MKKRWLAIICFGALAALGTELTPVLCLAGQDCAIQGLDGLDPKTVAVFREAGYDLYFDFYQNITPERLRQFPVVVGMIPQLHAGSIAIDDARAKALDDYLQAGGALVMMPEPSYYGVENFTTLVNPFLSRYGAKLSNEIPYDPEHEFTDDRVLQYRFFTTGNLKKEHPVTAGIDELIFPLDYSYNYVQTYTMTLDDSWDIPVRGEESAITSPRQSLLARQPEVGLWDAAPPLLAVRDVGKGKLAILASSSRYFLYDAYHWAVSAGLVLEKGNGLKLLTQLFAYLSGGRNNLHVSRPEHQTIVAKPHLGNVPVVQDKLEWFQQVVDALTENGYGVVYQLDAGAIADLPYAKERGYGYTGEAGSSWLVRWAWSEIFHPTASNVRAADIKPFGYRFDGLDPKGDYRLGLVLWAYQDAAARELEVSWKGGSKTLPIPRFSQADGPRLEWLELAPGAVSADGTLELQFRRGNGGEGEFTSVGEIWLAQRGVRTVNAGEIAAAFNFPDERGAEMPEARQMYTGVIGAHSPYSDGLDSVAAMAQAARRAGLDFIVYTDELDALTQSEWEQLRQDCEQASSNELLVIPGLELAAQYDLAYRATDPTSYGPVRSYFAGPIRQLPTAEQRRNPYELFWKFFGGELVGGKGTPGNLSTPSKNPLSPYFQRFWRGFDLVTFDADGQVADDARELFAALQADGYGPRPRVSGVYRSAGELEQAARQWRTVVWGWNRNEILDNFYSSAATSGPRLNSVQYSFDHMRSGEVGNGASFRGTTWIYAHLEVEYEQPITEAILLVNGRTVRHFFPNREPVRLVEPVRLDGQSELAWIVRAADGTEARTGSFSMLDERFRNAMCADNQNSIGSVTIAPKQFVRDERELYLQHSYWHTGETIGQLGVMRDARELVPRIIETGIIQMCKYFHPEASMSFADGSQESHTNAEMRIRSASQNHYRITYDYAPEGAKLSSALDLTAFRPAAAGGATAMLVENTVTAQQPLPATQWTRLQLLGVALSPAFPTNWQYTFDTPSGLETGAFAALAEQETARQTLAASGGVLVWPNAMANLAIFPLDGQNYEAEAMVMEKVWNGRERVTLHLPPRDLAAGDTIAGRFVVMLSQEPVESAEALRQLAQEYTRRGEWVNEVTNGTLQRADYVLDFIAADGGAAWELAPWSGRDLIPFRVRGLNPNWSGVVSRNGKLEAAEIDDGILYGLAGMPETEHVIAGHPVLADREEAVLEWGDVSGKTIRLRIHNPGAQTMELELWSNPVFEDLPQVRGKFRLAPGESRFVTLQ